MLLLLLDVAGVTKMRIENFRHSPSRAAAAAMGRQTDVIITHSEGSFGERISLAPLNQIRGYAYVAGVLRSQTTDPFCRSCNSSAIIFGALKNELSVFDASSMNQAQAGPDGGRLFTGTRAAIALTHGAGDPSEREPGRGLQAPAKEPALSTIPVPASRMSGLRNNSFFRPPLVAEEAVCAIIKPGLQVYSRQ